jgi:hypothetical protein
MVAKVDPQVVQAAINRIAAQPTQRIVSFVPRFLSEAYLYDYVDDARTLYRLNRVLGSVKLAALPDNLLDWMPPARRRVYELAPTMLTPPVTAHQNGLVDSKVFPESKL